MMALVASCGGGGGSASRSPGPVPSVGSLPQGATVTPVTVSFSFSPGASVASADRPQSLPAGLLAITLSVYAAGAQPPSSPTFIGDLAVPPTNGAPQICTISGSTETCSMTVDAPVGNDVFTVQLYNQEPICTPACTSIPASATLLAGGEAGGNIVYNAANTISLPLAVPFQNPAVALSPASAWSPSPIAAIPNSLVTGGTIQFGLPSGSVSGTAQISISPVSAPPVALPSGNTFVYGFGLTLVGETALSNPLSLAGTTLNIANVSQALSTSARARPLASSAPSLDVSEFDGLTFNDVGSLSYTLAGDVLTLGTGPTGMTQTGIYALSIPSSVLPSPSPTSSPGGGGLVIIAIPAAAPVVCSPASVNVTVGQTVVITCTAQDSGGPFALSVANPAIANVQLFNSENLTIFNVTGLAAGSTTLTVQSVPGGTGSVPIVVSP